MMLRMISLQIQPKYKCCRFFQMEAFRAEICTVHNFFFVFSFYKYKCNGAAHELYSEQKRMWVLAKLPQHKCTVMHLYSILGRGLFSLSSLFLHGHFKYFPLLLKCSICNRALKLNLQLSFGTQSSSIIIIFTIDLDKPMKINIATYS